MNSFEFGRPVQIRGEIFYITDELERAQKIMTKLEKSLIKPNVTEAQIKMEFKDALDTILGKGAFEKIFKKKKFTIGRETALLLFLAREIRLWQQEMEADMTAAPTEDQ